MLLVFLSKINRLPVLRKFGQVFVPNEVIAEIKYKQDDLSAAVINASGDWLKVKHVKENDLLHVLTKELDSGEAEVICLAIEQKADWVILDDQDARRFAHRYGLNVIGTLGLLAWAKKNGLVKSLKKKIEKLQNLGFYATASLIENILIEAKEDYFWFTYLQIRQSSSPPFLAHRTPGT